MTIDEAIEIETHLAELALKVGNKRNEQAHRLGIEALKEAQRWRAGQPLHLPNLLPGETEE